MSVRTPIARSITCRVIIALLVIISLAASAHAQGKYVVGRTIYRGKVLERILVPGKPPTGWVPRGQYAFPHRSVSSTVLANMPAFTWSYGCSATSAAMIAGYYDNNGFPNIYTGPTNGGVCPMNNEVFWGHTFYPLADNVGECPISATHIGYDGRVVNGSVEDYWVDYGDAGPDPYIVNGWTEHAPESTGDFMGTNQSKWANQGDGGTWFFAYPDGTPLVDLTDYYDNETGYTYRDGCHGFRLYIESRGYPVFTNYTRRINGVSGVTNGYTFADFQADILKGNPVLIQVEGHTMVGFGFDTAANTINIKNTWDNGSDTMTWAGAYHGMQHYAVTVLEMDRPPVAPTTCTVTPSPAAESVDLTATPSGASDPNGTAVSHIYQWHVKPFGGAYGAWTDGTATVPASSTTAKDTWQARVMVSSGTPTQYSGWTLSNEVSISNPPAQPTLVIAPSPCTTLQDLTATASGQSDPDGDPITAEEYRWSESSTSGASWTTLAGQTTNTLSNTLTTKGRWYRCEYRYQAGGDWTTLVEAISVCNDTGPTNPTSAVLTPDPAVTTDNLTAVGTGSQDDDNEAITYQYEWRHGSTIDLSAEAWVAGTDTTNQSATLKGQYWQFRVRASSGSPTPTTSDWQQSNVIFIGDTAPITPNKITYTPANPKTLDNVVAVASGSTDPDATEGVDTLNYKYQWQKLVLGIWQDLGGATTDTLDNALTEKGDTFRCVAIAEGTNGSLTGQSAPFNGLDLPIGNSSPVLPAKPTIAPVPPLAGADLTASYVAPTPQDPDSADTVSYVFKWARSLDKGGTWGAWQDGTGTNGQTLPGTSTAKGQYWKAKLTLTDSDATPLSVTIETDPVEIIDRPPTGTVTVTVTPTSPRTADALAAAVEGGSDPDGDALTYEIQWAYSDNNGGTWSAWGNDGDTINADLTTKHQQWKAQARAVSGFPLNPGVWFESNVVTIANTAPPAPGSVTITPATPDITQDLTATAELGTDADGDALSPVIQWSKSSDNGATWSAWGLDGATLNKSNLVKGDRWRARAAAVDGDDDDDDGDIDADDHGVWRASASVTVINLAPTAPQGVVITPAPAYTDSVLTAQATGGADPDGTATLAYEYEWAVSTDGGTTWSEWDHPGASLPASATTKLEVWKVRAFTFDGTVMSDTAVESAPIAIQDSPPTPPTEIVVTPSSPTAGAALTAEASGSTDPDGDPITGYLFRWSSRTPTNMTWTPWVDGATIPAGQTVRGQQWRVRARALSGGVPGSPSKGPKPGNLESSEFAMPGAITIGNTAPTAPAAFAISPASPLTDDALTVSPTGSTDVDGDSPTYQVQWCKSVDAGLSWSGWGYTGETLSALRTTRGELWKARARAYDRRTYGAFTISEPVTIGNTAPTDPLEVSLTPGDGNLADRLFASAAGSTDADGDSIQYGFHWARSLDGGATWSDWKWDGAVLPPSVVSIADMWKVRARASDSTSKCSNWVESAPLQLHVLARNTRPLNASVNIQRAAPLGVCFYRAVNEATAEARFTVRATGGATVPGTFMWTSPGRYMHFRPDAPLAASTAYTATISPGVQYASGAVTDWSESFSFTTGNEPVVSSYSPVGTGVTLASGINVTFDQDMDRASVRRNFLVQGPGGTAVAGRYVWFGNRQVTFDPTASLLPSTTYNVTIGLRCLNLTGSTSLRRDYNWTFTTGDGSAAPAMATAVATSTAAGAQITINLTAAADVNVAICNIAGRVVSVLPTSTLPSGTTTLLWDGRSSLGTKAPAGQYLVQIVVRSANGGSARTVTTLRR
ncbi:MAG: Ig-like domain-containing protein [Armatimonadia bacterium]